MLRYIALLAVLAACSSGGDLATPTPATTDQPDSSTSPASDSTPNPAPEPQPNRAPVAINDTVRVTPGGTVTVGSLLANDYDPDGDPLVAYPNGASVQWNPETLQTEYAGNLGGWEQHYAGGVAYGWNIRGGFSFSAFAGFTGTVEIPYQAIEEGPLTTASAPAKVVIVVE